MTSYQGPILSTELLLLIRTLRTRLCFQLGLVCWKKEWQKNIDVVNEEYSHKWYWYGYGLGYSRKWSTFIVRDNDVAPSSNVHWTEIIAHSLCSVPQFADSETFNYRNLENPYDDYHLDGHLAFFPRMPVYDKKRVNLANFPTMWYYYSIRHQMDRPIGYDVL